MAMADIETARAPHLVPLASQARYAGAGAAVGGALALAVLLPTADPGDLRGGKLAGQLALTAAVLLLWAYQQFGRRSRVRTAGEYAAALPAPGTLWQDTAARSSDLRHGGVVMGLVAAAWALVCTQLGHLPLAGAAFPLMMLLGVVQSRQTVRWERAHGVVLWKPALTRVGPGAYGRSPHYATPAEVRPPR